MATEYNISRTAGQCLRCETPLEEDQEYMAVVVEVDEQLERQDWCLPCWEAPDREEIAEVFGQWRTRVPLGKRKRKLFVDDALLVNFFERLADADDPAKLNFRFVLALVLMRKKLLIYERAVKDDPGGERWIMRLKGERDTCEVVDPKLDEEKVAAVSEQLRDILQGEL